MFFPILLLIPLVSQASKATYSCKWLENTWKEDGMLTKSMMKSYCDEECSFLMFDCDVTESVSPFDEHFKSLVNFFEVISNPDVDVESIYDAIEITEDQTEVLKDLFWWIAPVFIGLFAIFVIKWYKVESRGAIALYVILVLILTYPLNKAWSILFFNMLCVSLVLFLGQTQTMPFEVIGLFVAFFVFILASFLLTAELQLVMVLFLIMGFFGYLRFIFIDRKHVSTVSVLLTVSIVWVLVDEVHFINRTMAIKSPTFTAVQGMLYALFPYGKSATLRTNVGRYVANFMRFYTWGVGDRIYYGLLGWVLFVIMFLVFRALIGLSLILSMNIKIEVEHLPKGLYLYMINFYRPIALSIRLITMQCEWTSKNLFCGFGLLGIGFLEAVYAFDFFILRVMLSVLDSLFLDTNLGKVPTFLNGNIDFQGMAFPCEGSKAFFSLGKLCELRSAVIRASVLFKDKSIPIVGTLRNSIKNKVSVFTTIGHNLDSVSGLRVCDSTYSDESIDSRIISDNDDPIVEVELDRKYDAGKVFKYITADDLDFIDMLFVVIPPGDGNSEHMICAVPNWKLNKGYLQLSVDLKSGDSGSPVFAILKNTGKIVFCGCVSAGTSSNGYPNLFSFVNVCHDAEYSSDDESDSDRFNTRRRNKDYLSSIQQLISNRDQLLDAWRDSLKERAKKLGWAEKDRGNDMDPYDLPDYDGIGSYDFKRNDKRDNRRRNKDRAVAKRRVKQVEDFELLVREVFPHSEAKIRSLVDAFIEGRRIACDNLRELTVSGDGIIQENMIRILDDLKDL